MKYSDGEGKQGTWQMFPEALDKAIEEAYNKKKSFFKVNNPNLDADNSVPFLQIFFCDAVQVAQHQQDQYQENLEGWDLASKQFPFKHVSKHMHRCMKRFSGKWKYFKGGYRGVGQKTSDLIESAYKLFIGKRHSLSEKTHTKFTVQPDDKDRPKSTYEVRFCDGLMQIGTSDQGGDFKRAPVVRVE